jgi:hypothetical protein
MSCSPILRSARPEQGSSILQRTCLCGDSRCDLPRLRWCGCCGRFSLAPRPGRGPGRRLGVLRGVRTFECCSWARRPAYLLDRERAEPFWRFCGTSEREGGTLGLKPRGHALGGRVSVRTRDRGLPARSPCRGGQRACACQSNRSAELALVPMHLTCVRRLCNDLSAWPITSARVRRARARAV